MHNAVTAADRRALADDGAVCLPRVLDAQTLAEAERVYEWSLAHPSRASCSFYAQDDGTFYQDLCHPDAPAVYRDLLERSCIADLVAALWGEDDVWFLYEQVFHKHGGATRRTPWHQDAPYLALDGSHIAVVWINFEPVADGQSLEFVRGSHRGPLYDGTVFNDDDVTAPLYGTGELPRLPDIEASRAQWDIVSWPVAPGDVVVFHPQTLHGGAPTTAGVTRRTLSLRFFGPDARYARRPGRAVAPRVPGLAETLAPGDPFRHPAFLKLRGVNPPPTR